MPNHGASGVYLGLDYGTRRIGVAVGQALTHAAQPLTVMPTSRFFQDITAVIEAWRPQAFVVGRPLNMDGTTQAITARADRFIAALQQRTGLPVYAADERLTSVEARAHVFREGGYRQLRRQAVDSVAAQLLLESWLQASA